MDHRFRERCLLWREGASTHLVNLGSLQCRLVGFGCSLQENVTHLSAVDGRQKDGSASLARACSSVHPPARKAMKGHEPEKAEPSTAIHRRPRDRAGMLARTNTGAARGRGRASQGWIGSTLSRAEEGDFERRTDDRGEGNASRPKATWPSLSKVLASVARRRIHSSV